MKQNKRLLLKKKAPSAAKAAIFGEAENTLVLDQSAGRIWEEVGVSNDLLLSHQAESIKSESVSNTLALTDAASGDRRNPAEEHDLVLSDALGTQVDYTRSLSNTLALTHSVTGYLANRIPPPVPGVCPEEPLEGFTLEEI
jgi:hypothetical protein